MDKTDFNEDWVDRYVRNELTPDQEAEFEVAVLESPRLQQMLEEAMAVRQAFVLEGKQDLAKPASKVVSASGWQPLALAASVVLAVFSTTMYWRTSNQLGNLQEEFDALGKPRTGLLTVPVDIMRSGGSQTPDVIFQKPADDKLVVLDIELSAPVASLEEVHMALVDQQGVTFESWVSAPGPSGKVQVVFDASRLPAGKVWLQMSDARGEVVDRRLLEILP